MINYRRRLSREKSGSSILSVLLPFWNNTQMRFKKKIRERREGDLKRDQS